MMRSNLVTAAFAVAVLLVGAGPVIADDSACDITDLPCWGPDHKCNIKMINNTGKASGSGGSHFNQASWAVTVRVEAQKPGGNRAGSNTLEILAGQSKTINMDKKKGFDHIKISSATTGKKKGIADISCDQIRDILKNNKNCKILVDEEKSAGNIDYYLAYICGVAYGEGYDAIGGW
jgi:hypothetical protein